jgi:hypothetical protein
MDVLDVILILFGLFTLYGVLAKPDFYWNRGRIRRARDLIGDKKTHNMYLFAGVLMLIFGALGAFGVL